MSDPIDVDILTQRGEDAITATWLDDNGPYLGLQLEGHDEESDEALDRG